MGRLPSLIAVVLFVAGCIYSAWLGPELRYEDERAYSAIASHLPWIYSLDGEQPTALWPPAWPVLLATVGGSPVGGRCINFALLAGTVLMAARLAGPWAAVVLACYPALFYTAGTLYPQTLALFLLAVALLARRLERWALLGVTLGALVLTAPLFAVVGVVLLPWRSPRFALVWFCAFALVMAWCFRVRLVTGGWAFVSTNGGYNLLVGNTPDATAGSGVSVQVGAFEGGELARDRAMRAVAIHQVFGDPIRAAGHYFAKLAHHFHFRNDLATGGEGSGLKDVLMLLTWGPILGLACWRCTRWPLSDEERLWVVAYVAFALAQAAFFTRIRYRLPLDIIPVMLAAGVFRRTLRTEGTPWTGPS